jgi:predicted permease
MFADLMFRLRALFRRKAVEHELQNELRFHYAQQAEKHVRAGMTEEEAQRIARLEIGGTDQITEECREARGVHWIENLFRDLRYSLRKLKSAPGFTSAAVVTLSLGIGVNTAIFSMVDWIALRPLPVKDAGRLVYITVQHQSGAYSNGFSYPNFEDIRNQSSSVFSQIAGVEPFQMDGLTVDRRTEPLWTNYVTGDFFQMLGIQPVLGRFILPSEGSTPGADPVLVIGYACWQSRFGGDPNVIGRQVAINGHPVRIIGVAPKDFHGALAILDTQGYLPISLAGFNFPDKKHFLTDRLDAIDVIILARLKDGVTLAQAQPPLQVIAKRLAQQYPKVDDWRAMNASRLTSAPPSAHGNSPVPIIAGIFLSLAGLVLLLACVNVANLLLVRAGVRAREMAVRSALGASRNRLITQSLTESILLALLGCAGGVLVGFAGSTALNHINLGSAVPVVLSFGLNVRVFSYSLTAALFTGIAVGIIPALRGSRISFNEVLHEGGRTSTARGQRLRSVFVVAEVAGSLMLLIVAGLCVRSLEMAQNVDLGFESSHLLTVTLDPHQAGYNREKGSAFFEQLLAHVRAMPGVRSAATAAALPMGLSDAHQYGSPLTIPGYEARTPKDLPYAGYDAVSTDYFSTMKMPLLRGRDVLQSDDRSAPRIAIINEVMAQRFWPNQDPIGHSFTMKEDPSHSVQIIGIAKNSRMESISDPIGPFFFVPFAQQYETPATLQVRTFGDPTALARDVETTIRTMEPAMVIFDVMTMNQALQTINGLLLYKIGAGLAGAMGIIGLLLAIIGVYGIMSYAVSHRINEIGVRMALGASPPAILKMIFRQAVFIVTIGVVAGVLLAAATSQALRTILLGITPLDPVTYGTATIMLAATAFLAAYIPARRAVRVDPLIALRYE